MAHYSVSSLVSLAVGNESGPFADVIDRQIKALRKELKRGEEDDSKGQLGTVAKHLKVPVIDDEEGKRASDFIGEPSPQSRGLFEEWNAWRLRTGNRSSKIPRMAYAAFDPAF